MPCACIGSAHLASHRQLAGHRMQVGHDEFPDANVLPHDRRLGSRKSHAARTMVHVQCARSWNSRSTMRPRVVTACHHPWRPSTLYRKYGTFPELDGLTSHPHASMCGGRARISHDRPSDPRPACTSALLFRVNSTVRLGRAIACSPSKQGALSRHPPGQKTRHQGRSGHGGQAGTAAAAGSWTGWAHSTANLLSGGQQRVL